MADTLDGDAIASSNEQQVVTGVMTGIKSESAGHRADPVASMWHGEALGKQAQQPRRPRRDRRRKLKSVAWSVVVVALIGTFSVLYYTVNYADEYLVG
jgi:hypothetical protein